MKNIRSIILFSLFLFVGLASLFAGGAKDANQSPQIPQIDDNKLIVYCGDSFSDGVGKDIAKLFKAETGIDLTFSVVEQKVLVKAIIEGANTEADILLGIENYDIERARKAKILQAYHPKGIDKKIDPNTVIGKDWLLTPYEFGYMTFMFDTNSNLKAPKKLSDLTKPEYKAKFVIYDPEMSEAGSGFPIWISAVYGDKADEFFKKFKENVFAMTPSWSKGYFSLFTTGEAPFAFSYTSSLAAHVLYDNTDRFQPIIFEDGHICQVNGMGISAYSKRVKNAKAFIDFMLSEKVQKLFANGDFMYPVLKDLELPESYKTVPVPDKVLKIPSKGIGRIIKSAKNELQK